MTGWSQVPGFRGQASIADRPEWDDDYLEILAVPRPAEG